MTQHRITDDLDALLEVLPTSIRHAVEKANNSDRLLEIVIDLGRVPTARFVEGEIVLSEKEITRAEIDHITERIGTFDADNRAGMERTLHRISAIRNRRSAIVGLTCRVGRAVYGTVDIIQDIIESGKSVLILGRPGVGKTTLLREAARILAENKRVVIVDTSNEIGGDGDVPHPAVGKARRMQVREPMLQHEVMIEAVENHNPEVIVIDEIGRELEALAARTIAERGVQLIGTAHGQTLENLLLNPTLSDLVGGIEAVTLSDEEARRRGTQKTVLERRAPPTFDVLIEIQHRERFAVHLDIMSAVDALLRDVPMPPEIRTRDEAGQIQIEKLAPPKPAAKADVKVPRRGRGTVDQTTGRPAPVIQEQTQRSDSINPPAINTPSVGAKLQTVRVFAYGVARNRLMQAAKRIGVPAVVVADVSDADVLVTLRTYYRNREKTVIDAESRGMPIYVLRANTVAQVEQFLGDLYNLTEHQAPRDNMEDIRGQTEQAISAVLNGERWVDLPPGPSLVRRVQHEMARNAELVSHSYGKEPRRHVRIFRE
ncbi:R3H domain-containing nucleic acid-binding protein [Candidatus Villigracilis affinis]|uniref:R3H domain-containing nucleic acid-binding protein n=1 Tax=Candidatus Villigracilis affinis TaxID=3140682 RepID=UPI001DCDAC8D|nr:AAA family ATPase [Anaerolineales bacterium]